MANTNHTMIFKQLNLKITNKNEKENVIKFLRDNLLKIFELMK